MAWVNVLAMEPFTGTRSTSIVPPITAKAFKYQCPRSLASATNPENRITMMGWRVKIGSANSSRTPLQGFPAGTEGDATNDNSEAFGIINPVQILNMLGNERLEFEMVMTNENGSPPTECGLQIEWYDVQGNRLDGSGNLDP